MYKRVHTCLNDVHTCLYLNMYERVHTVYIHVYKYSEMYVRVHTFREMYEHVCTAYMIRTYYSIVHTYHISRTDTYVHVYARCIGFQMHGHCTVTRVAGQSPGPAAGQGGSRGSSHGAALSQAQLPT